MLGNKKPQSRCPEAAPWRSIVPKPIFFSCSPTRAHLQTALAELHLPRAPSLMPQEPQLRLAALPHLLNPLSHMNHVPFSSQRPCHTPASTRDDDLGVTDGMTKRRQIHFPEPPDLPHRIPADDLGAASSFGAVRADHSSHSAPPRLCSPTKSRDLAQDETRARSNSVLGAPVNPSALPAWTLGLCQYSHPNQSMPSPRAVGWAVWMCWAVWEHSGALVAFFGQCL